MASYLGDCIPSGDLHALSTSMPEWRDNVGYANGEDRVIGALQTGYPRFFIHPIVKQLFAVVESLFATPGQDLRALVFPNGHLARAAQEFIIFEEPTANVVVHAVLCGTTDSSTLHAVLVPDTLTLWTRARQFWQHTGWGVSSRLSAACLERLKLIEGGRGTVNMTSTRLTDAASYQAHQAAKRELQELISGWAYPDPVQPGSIGRASAPGPDDVFLYTSGMSSIYVLHHAILQTQRQARNSVCFGFGYTDTIKILTRWGPGCNHFGRGDAADISALSTLLASDEAEIPCALWCEAPSNPLLRSVDLPALRVLADKWGFPIIIDDTVGNFANLDVLRFVDAIVTSLTKIISGRQNVMGGSIVLNPSSPYYSALKASLSTGYTPEQYDTWYYEDAIQMASNARGFVARAATINQRAEPVADLLYHHSTLEGSALRKVHYPKYETRDKYDALRRRTPLVCGDGRTCESGYGGLISLLFHAPDAAHAFYDALGCAKGPSLGTDFTLACPYTILAHWRELEWAEGFGVEEALVRISVGCEDEATIIGWINVALRAAEAAMDRLSLGASSKPADSDSVSSDEEAATPEKY